MIAKRSFRPFLPTSFHVGERARDGLCDGGSLPLEAATPHTLLSLFLGLGIPYVMPSLFPIVDGASRGSPPLTIGRYPVDVLDHVPAQEGFHVLAGL
jgi:hypothetical protein